MKLLYSVLVLTACQTGVSFAQTSPSDKPASTSNQTTNRSTSTSTTNRQQELYDQYHGVTKKSTTTSTTPTNTIAASTPVAPTPVEQSAPMASGRTQPTDRYGNTSGVRIGVRGGVTYLAYLESQPLLKPAVGFTGGITFNFGAGTLSFQPEVNYTRYSDKINISNIITTTEAVDLIEVPLFLKISSGTYDGNRFFVNIGPYGSYIASASIDGKKLSLDGIRGRIGFGAAAGVGAALQAGPGHFTIEVRGLYNLGNTDDGFKTDSKTILAQAAIGYIFPLGGR